MATLEIPVDTMQSQFDKAVFLTVLPNLQKLACVSPDACRNFTMNVFQFIEVAMQEHQLSRQGFHTLEVGEYADQSRKPPGMEQYVWRAYTVTLRGEDVELVLYCQWGGQYWTSTLKSNQADPAQGIWHTVASR